jgi:hypothetical protein
MTVPQIYTVIVLAALGATACAWQVYRALREPSERDRIVAEARARTGLPPAAPDNVPGVNGADLDECELIWATPDTAGLDRLRQAIRDHREETGE